MSNINKAPYDPTRKLYISPKELRNWAQLYSFAPNTCQIFHEVADKIEQLEADKLELCMALEKAIDQMRALNGGNEFLVEHMKPYHDVWKKHDPEWQRLGSEIAKANEEEKAKYAQGRSTKE